LDYRLVRLSEFAHATNYLIDVEHGVTMDAKPSPVHRTTKVECTKTMTERVEEPFDIKLDRLQLPGMSGTKALISGARLDWLITDCVLLKVLARTVKEQMAETSWESLIVSSYTCR